MTDLSKIAVEDAVIVDDEDLTFNDADLFGEETEGYLSLLDQPAKLMLGEVWGKDGRKDRRNTQDGEWNTVELPWSAWIVGGDGDKNNPAWGFSRHPVGKNKAGACVVLGSSIGGARMAKSMDTMYAMGVDIDSGASLDSMLDRLQELGVFCLVYTSYSHGRSGLQLKHDDVIRKLKIKPSELNRTQVQRYLREFDKNRYDDAFINAVDIVTMKMQVKDGVVIDLSTPPLDKYRLIFPLATPVKLIDLAETQTAALEAWENKITGLATEFLCVHFDTSCTDPSRLFYTARHAKDAADWYCAIVRGEPLKFEDVPSVKKSSYTNNRRPLNAFEMAGGAGDGDGGVPLCFTPSGASLNEWHRKAKDRFNMADLLEDLCPDRIRVAGGEAQGHVHIECPFEGEHTSEGGTATMVVNAIDSPNGYWTWFCHHDACQGRHKLQFLEEALRQGWFDEKYLFGDSVYMLDGYDEEEEDDEAPRDRTERHALRATSVRDDLLSMVESFNINTTDPEVEELIRVALDSDADSSTMGHLKDAIAAKTKIKARSFTEKWNAAKKARVRRKPKGRSSEDIESCHVKDDFQDQLEYARRRIREANEERPRIFQFGGGYVTADAVRHRVRTIEDRDSLHFILQDVTRWNANVKIGDDWEVRKVPPPESVVRTLHKDHDFADTLPELLAVPATPFFDAEGRLVAEEGYHEGAKVYLAPGDLEVARVSEVPSAEEVKEAKRLLLEEVIADFPLGGLTRDEIVKGEHPAVTHAVALALLPFCRDMISGPTPGHVFTKPGPGTGASLLVNVLTTIAGGTPAPAMELPGHKDEISKTLSAALSEGAPVILFDNVGNAIASPALASAMTESTYQARILGKTQTVTVPVRAVWVFTANNIEASEEIIRRLVLIPLDAGVPDPKNRIPAKGWRHSNLRQWVTQNRPRLIWACLTLIQNWVAGGMQRASKALASYEDWAGVMGGILAAANFTGFLEGQDEEQAKAADSVADGLSQFVSVLADYPAGTIFRPGGSAKFGGEPTVSVLDILNGKERADFSSKDAPDPIQINGWGYSSHDGAYTTSGRIGRGMKVFARKPYRAGTEILHFDELSDTKNGASVYRLRKEAA